MGISVLAADDSATMRRAMAITFAGDEYDLVVVENGAQALAKARERVPDVALLDTSLPDMSGYDLCAAFRRDPALQDVGILLLTSRFAPYDEKKGAQAGADGFVDKPFETDKLLARVAEVHKVVLERRPVQEIVAEPPPIPADSRKTPAPERPSTSESNPPAPAVASSVSGASLRPSLLPGAPIPKVGQSAAIAPLTPPEVRRPGPPPRGTSVEVPLGVGSGGSVAEARVAAPAGSSSGSVVARLRLEKRGIPRPMEARLDEIAQRGPEYAAIASLSREVIERIAWEVVPDLAEAIIREEIERLVAARGTSGGRPGEK